MIDNVKMLKQHVMLPHDICGALYKWPGVFHYLLTGTPGKLQEYWANNSDLEAEVRLPGVAAKSKSKLFSFRKLVFP